MHYYPVVVLPGTEGDAWYDGYEWGNSLAEAFPHEDPRDFAYAASYHLDKSIFEHGLTFLKLVKQGYNDNGPWLWYVEVNGADVVTPHGTTYAHTKAYLVSGWCDYTGWDCRSGAYIQEVDL